MAVSHHETNCRSAYKMKPLACDEKLVYALI